MELTLEPNPLHNQRQTLEIDKVATLIGENGSGKSCILQSVFEKKLTNSEDIAHLRVICFSSGQNENFSQRFGRYLTSARTETDEPNLDCFYYDKSWSKLLIFLATSIYSDGHVRRFLRDGGYVEESQAHADTRNEDVSTKLSLKFRVPRNYVAQVQDALKREESGSTDTLRHTPYFRSLDSFITEIVDSEYTFEDPIAKGARQLTPDHLFRVSFRGYNSGVSEAGWPVGTPHKDMGIISFFTQAAANDYFIDKNSMKLQFKGGLEMDLLSDGEYQMLFLYALIDLFDSPNTLFLLDEADSHLHYENIDRLWKVLSGIMGKAITTTHLLDSITANDFHALKVVEKGRISDHDKLKQLIERLKVLSRASSVEYEICAKLNHMALMDDYNDWKIFRALAERKGLDISRLESVYTFKKASSYNTTAESFGKAKIQWLEGLSNVETEFVTSQVFLICDKDEAALSFDGSGVKVCGQNYRDQIRSISWPNNARVTVHLLAWKRREIKNYLLSHAALLHHGVLDQVNSAELAVANHLQAGNSGDNEGICNLNVKEIVNPFINEEGVGLCMDKLQTYINLIPPEEISEDIENMYNYIVNNL